MTTPKEFQIVGLRECATGPVVADAPEHVAEYWWRHITPGIDPDREHLVALLLNTRCRIMGHHLVGIGTLDSVLLSAREIFRAAIIGAAHSIVLAHNHPSGEPSPSRMDLKITRQMIQAGLTVGIELKDHVIIGAVGKFCSLRAIGAFAPPKTKRKNRLKL